MNINTEVGRMLHDALMKVVDPGKTFSAAFLWCEDYIDRELAYQQGNDNPGAAVRSAVRAWKREHQTD